jgi:hypothetical protein
VRETSGFSNLVSFLEHLYRVHLHLALIAQQQTPQYLDLGVRQMNGTRVGGRTPSSRGGPHTPQFCRTLPGLKTKQLDVMILGDLHLREDTMEQFCEARDEMKVMPAFCVTMVPAARWQASGEQAR